jgi:uncharacterized protein YutE (UPF0331/DUF86 family)
MVSRLVVQSRLDMIDDCVLRLSRFATLSRSDFVGDKDKVAAAESYLRRALEATFDVGRHILARSGGADLSTEYKGIAKGLGDKGIVPLELAGTLIDMAGYRNRLVHLYHLVQEDELYEILQTDLDDLRAFVREINVFLDAVKN